MSIKTGSDITRAGPVFIDIGIKKGIVLRLFSSLLAAVGTVSVMLIIMKRRKKDVEQMLV